MSRVKLVKRLSFLQTVTLEEVGEGKKSYLYHKKKKKQHLSKDIRMVYCQPRSNNFSHFLNLSGCTTKAGLYTQS